ncbi:MAG: hypothetical protein HY756_05605 [Nitrospirae bacterium]|nr:hypothetical protein [Nitrospirota bacterium]
MPEKDTNNKTVKEKLYLVNFEFICGEYEQKFDRLFYARNANNLEKRVHIYLSNYYGTALAEIDDDVYYYWDSEVAVKFNGYSEIKNLEDIISRMLS